MNTISLFLLKLVQLLNPHYSVRVYVPGLLPKDYTDSNGILLIAEELTKDHCVYPASESWF